MKEAILNSVCETASPLVLTGRKLYTSDHIVCKTLSALLAWFTGAHVLVLFLNHGFFFSVQFKSFDILEDQEVGILIFQDQNHMSWLLFKNWVKNTGGWVEAATLNNILNYCGTGVSLLKYPFLYFRFPKSMLTALLFRVYSRNWPMRVKWAPFCNFRGPSFKKRGPRKGVPQKVLWTLYWYLVYWRFAAISEHSGQL